MKTKIVIDTNIVASAIFFGGKPLKLIQLLLTDKINAAATPKIIDEYQATINYLLEKYNGKNLKIPLAQIVSKMDIVYATTDIHICRDSDDDKFISCAKAANAFYIVSGDNDLLSLEKYENIKIINAAEFLEIFEK